MNKSQKYNASEKGKLARKKYRQTRGRHITSAKYLSKPFIAVGGLAMETDDKEKQIYFCVALSNGKKIINLNGLSTNEIFSFIFDNTPKDKEAIIVSYGSTFDFNNWLKDLTMEQLQALYKSNYRTKPISAGMWSLKFARGQALTIYDLWGERRTTNDIYNFFQVPIYRAVKEYLDLDLPHKTKFEKTVFPSTYDNSIKELQAELKAIEQLITEFRRRLDKVFMRPRRWNGSGSITQTLFERNKIKNHMAEHPSDIQKIIRYAYAGGRFEMCLYGSMTKQKSYAYDINSAYPEALTKLPSLANGRWLHIDGDAGDSPYGLYKVKMSARQATLPHPLFARDIKGQISYPRSLEGWYWSPEIKVLRKWKELGYGDFEIEQCFLFDPATDEKPFAWIEDVYKQRLELQRKNDEAEIGLKLALNSAYGKLAQQLGYLPAEGKDPEKIPSYHQLDWAGFVTSYTRAKIYETALENLTAVIAFETDALYTTNEFYQIPIGDNLGEFRETVYEELTYINSGIYFGVKQTGEIVFKLRGLQSGTVDLDEIDQILDTPENKRVLEIKQNRFISGALAVQMADLEQWRKWKEEIMELRLYPVGKRAHYLCVCNDEETGKFTRDFWHLTTPAKPYKQMVEYCVEWINPEPLQLLMRHANKLDKETLI